MDDEEDSRKLALLEYKVNEQIAPKVNEHEKQIQNLTLWSKLAAWTLGLVGALNTPIGKKISDFFTNQ